MVLPIDAVHTGTHIFVAAQLAAVNQPGDEFNGSQLLDQGRGERDFIHAVQNFAGRCGCFSPLDRVDLDEHDVGGIALVKNG